METAAIRPTYETLYTRTQEIVAQLEAGELSLDQALALYEEGTRVIAACQRLLDEAELRVQELQSDMTGTQPRRWEE